ncbi:CIS tube protein [Phytohabitans rumicis]|nr:hypothetical protein [Phytohabitans rumicis]
MPRKTGYLANITNVPPLIFRFQFNPELLSEKKSFGYREANNFGSWDFDQSEAGVGAIGFGLGVFDDFKEMGSLLVGTKPLEADAGKPRTFALDFALDARAASEIPPPPIVPPATAPDDVIPIDDDPRFAGRIEPSLAVLRSFMNPAWDALSDVLAFIGPKKFCPPTRPPTCNLKLGDIDLVCVMTDLNIKITKFKEDLTPLRAEISLTLSEQTHSIATSLDWIGRHVEVAKSYGQLNLSDLKHVLPGAGVAQTIFS